MDSSASPQDELKPLTRLVVKTQNVLFDKEPQTLDSVISSLPLTIVPSLTRSSSNQKVNKSSGADSTRSRGFRYGTVRKQKKRVILKNGECNIVQSKMSQKRLRFIQDIFTTFVDVQWRYTLLAFALSFILSWLFFAIIWWLISFTHGDFEESHLPSAQDESGWMPCVYNIHSFTSCFLFSIETQHTIGYGVRTTTEECPEAIFIMCIQSIYGVMLQAFMVGIVFAKMTRPKHRTQTLLFSKYAVICQRDGELCLMFRVGDMRKSHIIGANVRAQLIRTKTTKEGEVMSQYQTELSVGSDGCANDLFFIWPLIVSHKIDENSPLYNTSASDMIHERFEIVVILEGTVESTGQTTQARNSYLSSEVLWGHRFDPLVTYNKERQGYQIDYSKFDDTIQVDTPLCSAKELVDYYKYPDSLKSNGPGLRVMDLNGSSFNIKLEDLSRTDFFDFVSPLDMNSEINGAIENSSTNINDSHELQSFEQFWGQSKESQLFGTSVLDDQNGWASPSVTPNNTFNTNSFNDLVTTADSSLFNTDGQVYTITVLNSSLNNYVMKKGSSVDQSTNIDLDSILSTYSFSKIPNNSYDDDVKDVLKDNYVKFEDSEISSSKINSMTNNVFINQQIHDDSTSTQSYELDNNNDWKVVDQHIKKESAESLLRSALQGKGYIKSNQVVTDYVDSAKKNDCIRVVSYGSQEPTMVSELPLSSTEIFDEASTQFAGNVMIDDIFFALESTTSQKDNNDLCKKNNLNEAHTILSISSSKENMDVKPTKKRKFHQKNPDKFKKNNNSKLNNNSKVRMKKYKKCNNDNESVQSSAAGDFNGKSDNNNNDDYNNCNNLLDNSNNFSENPIQTIYLESSTSSQNTLPSSLKIINTVDSSISCNQITNIGQRKERSLHYCSVCSKGFKDKYSVTVHHRIHSGEKPFVCSFCSKRFRQKAHLAKHYQTHIAQKNNQAGFASKVVK